MARTYDMRHWDELYTRATPEVAKTKVRELKKKGIKAVAIRNNDYTVLVPRAARKFID